jgi:hypothetical protein
MKFLTMVRGAVGWLANLLHVPPFVRPSPYRSHDPHFRRVQFRFLCELSPLYTSASRNFECSFPTRPQLGIEFQTLDKQHSRPHGIRHEREPRQVDENPLTGT